ncbi:MAG: hypothetical protein DRQ37_00765 [Gammaproteobacteria bacterium]|nr:MAG: hypothetical protein DRQ37_00765 [Gammaproteobacteria bacterium]
MNHQSLNLPPLYEPVVLEEGGNAFAEACRRADDGAREGTLLWTRKPTEVQGRTGMPWLAGPNDLQCAVILEPDYPATEALQLVYVTAIATALAVADLVPPLTEMGYGWPNDVRLDGAKVAAVDLSAGKGPGGSFRWMVLGTRINVSTAPAGMEPEAASLQEEGAPSIEPTEVLERFARHFLTWSSRWADEGFAPVREAWQNHGPEIGHSMGINLPGKQSEGVFQGLDEAGNLNLLVADGSAENLSVAVAFGVDIG